MTRPVFYAIGDVHGMDAKLARLHEKIAQDIAGREAAIVHLGDYVDRGTASRAVIARIVALQAAPPPRVRVAALLGNHERMMLDAIDEAKRYSLSHWLFNGGDETIASYGADAQDKGWRAAIDPVHVDWLRALPAVICEHEFVFVHAGIEPAAFPDCEEDVLLWTRSERFFDTAHWPARPELEGICVVHGHTPTDDDYPYADVRRINVDTGAVFGGPLTCAVLAPGEKVRFLFA